jgi:hypothetical protein
MRDKGQMPHSSNCVYAVQNEMRTDAACRSRLCMRCGGNLLMAASRSRRLSHANTTAVLLFAPLQSWPCLMTHLLTRDIPG